MWKAIIVVVTVLLGLGYVLSGPYFFTPARTLYEIGVQKIDYESDAIYIDAQQEAAHYFERALAKGYRERKVYDALLSAYAHIASDSTTEQMLTRALADHPQDTEFLFWRAEKRMRLRKFTLAIQDYTHVITNKQSRRVAQEYSIYGRGAAWYMLGDTATAAQDYKLVHRLSGREWRDYIDFHQTLE